MNTYDFTRGELSGTLLLSRLDAKKHFYINSRLKMESLTASAVQKKAIRLRINEVKKLNDVEVKGNENDMRPYNLIDNSKSDEKFNAFMYSFLGDKSKNLQDKLEQIIKTINPRCLFIQIESLQGELSFPDEYGYELRKSIPLLRDLSPIVVNYYNEGIFKQNKIYVYIMAFDNTF